MQKQTKKALVLSVLSLVLCVSMLVGTTFAWFTDSVTTGVNKIQSGTLDVELYYQVEGQSDWTQVTDKTNVFKNGALWEPGYTEVVKLKIVNEGNLALKYQFGVNIASESGSINKAGEPFKLSDYIYFGIVEEELKDYDRDEAIAAVESSAKAIKAGYSKAGALEKEDDAQILTMVVYMPTTVGNEANYDNTKANAPVVNLGLNLYATQYTYESDSFGNQYDKSAPWTGTMIQPAQDENGVFQIGSAEELAWFAAYVNGTLNTRAVVTGHNAVLTSDIDLNNLPWTPIGRTITAAEKAAGHHSFDFQYHGTSSTHAVFDGQEHTVYNLNVDVDANAGLFGAAVYATIKNVNVDGAKLSSNHFAGTVLAQGYARVENCHVKNSTVLCTPELIDGAWDNGDKVGGVVGKISEGGANSPYGAVNCSAENVTVSAFRDAAGILGYAGDYAKVTGNKVDNITLIHDKTHDYKNYDDDAKYNVNPIVGDSTRAPGVVVDGNTVGKVSRGYIAGDNADVKDAINDAQPGETIALAPGATYTLPTLSNKEGITIEGNGATIGGKNASTGFSWGNFGKNNTYKDLTFTGSSNGTRWTYADGGVSTFENCTFAGDSTYGFHIDQSNGATFIFNNCTFSGFNAFASDLVKVVFNNCTFLHNGNYGHTNIWSVGEFNNCTWGDKASVSPAGSGKLFFNDVEESYHHEYIGSAESLFAFAKSVNEGGDKWAGQNVSLVNDIDLNNALWTPIGQTGATEFRGIFDGHGYTIKNLNVDSSAQTGEHYSSGLFGWCESGATIQNVKIDGAKIVGNHNVAGIVGYTYSSKIINCHVSNATIVCSHANGDACGDKCGAIVGYAGDESRITNCSASDSTITAGRDGGQLIGAGYNVSVTGCSATNVTVTAGGDCTGANINNAVIGRVLG